MVEQAKQEYGRDLKLSDQKRFESAAKQDGRGGEQGGG